MKGGRREGRKRIKERYAKSRERKVVQEMEEGDEWSGTNEGEGNGDEQAGLPLPEMGGAAIRARGIFLP